MYPFYFFYIIAITATNAANVINLLLWLPCVADADIIFLPCGFFLLFFLPRLISAVADWMFTILHTWCGLSANLECRSEMYCTQLSENTGCKKSPSQHHCTSLSCCVFATKAGIDNRKRTC